MKDIKHFKLRTPIEIANWVMKEAKENKRSLNAQILYCIEQTKKAVDQSPNIPTASLNNPLEKRM